MVVVVVNGIIHSVIDMGGFRIFVFVFVFVFFFCFLRRWPLGLVGQNMKHFLFYKDGCAPTLFAYY